MKVFGLWVAGIAVGLLVFGGLGYLAAGRWGAAFGFTFVFGVVANWFRHSDYLYDRLYSKRLNVKWEVSDWLPTFAVVGFGLAYIVFYSLQESMGGDAYHVLTRAVRPFVTSAGEYIPTLQLHKRGLILHGYAERVDFVSHVYVFSWAFAVLAGVTAAIFCVRRFDAIVELAHNFVAERQYFPIALLFTGILFLGLSVPFLFAYEPQIDFRGVGVGAISRIHVSNFYAIREFIMIVGGFAGTVWGFALFIAFLRAFFVSLSRPRTRE